ncbi:MAG: hypothetical protein ACREIU_05030 [Planctomycetota bacterium]
MADSARRREHLLLATAALAAVLGGFAGTTGGYFLTDDWFILGKAAQFRGGNLHHVFALGPGQLHWRPLADAVWAFEYDLFGLHPTGWHRVKLGLHAAGAFLLGILARRVTGRPGVGLLATLLALDRRAKGEGGLLPVGLAFAGALLSKETGATVLALGFAHAFLCASPGEERRRALRACGLLSGLTALYAAIRLAAGAVPGSESPFRPPFGEFLWSLSIGPIRWILGPVGETAHPNPANARLALGLVTGVVLARWLVARLPSWRPALLGLLAVPAAMLPIAPFFTSEVMGSEMWKGLFVGHYLLVPTAGFTLALAVAAGGERQGRGLRWLGPAFLVVLFGITLRRNLGPWIEAGEISARFAAGLREHVPVRRAGETVAVGLIGRPVWHRGVRIDAGQPLEFALEKGWPLPPYPTQRGIPLEEVQRYLTDVQTAMPYKPALYDTREQALAEARRALAEGQRPEDLVLLEWDSDARTLSRVPLPPAAPR